MNKLFTDTYFVKLILLFHPVWKWKKFLFYLWVVPGMLISTEGIGISFGWGVGGCKTKNFKEMCEAKLEFSELMGGGGGML